MSKRVFTIKFHNQSTRLDILKNMLHSRNYEDIITNNGAKEHDKSYQGFVFESICIILTLLKCLPINFSNFLVGKFEEYDSQQILDDVRKLLNVPIQQGNDKADMTLFDKINKKK